MHVEFSQLLGSGAVGVARFTGRPAVTGSPNPALRLPNCAAAMLATGLPLETLEVCSDDARGSSEDELRAVVDAHQNQAACARSTQSAASQSG
jgi:hypothetical protein